MATVITGLSGSGKSEYLNQMVEVIPFNEGVRPDKPENMEKFFDALEKQGQANFFEKSRVRQTFLSFYCFANRSIRFA